MNPEFDMFKDARQRLEYELTHLEFKKLHPDAIIPTRSYSGDAGLDLFSIEDVFIPLGATVKVPTGISVAVPYGCVGKIEDRSGMAVKGLRTGAGVVDTQYRGELSVVLHNLNNAHNSHAGVRGYLVKKGDRIAQLIVYNVHLLEPVEVLDLDSTTRGTGGFSSTGR